MSNQICHSNLLSSQISKTQSFLKFFEIEGVVSHHLLYWLDLLAKQMTGKVWMIQQDIQWCSEGMSIE